MKLNLQTRLFVGLLLLVLLTLVLTSSLLLQSAKQQLEQSRLYEAKQNATILADGSLDALVTKDFELLERLVASVLPSDEYAYAALVDINGKILTHSDISLIGHQVSSITTTNVTTERTAVYRNRPINIIIHPALIGEDIFAYAHIAYFLDTISVFSVGSLPSIIITILLTLFILSVGSYFITRRVVSPIENLIQIVSNTSLIQSGKQNLFRNDKHFQQLSRRDDEIGLLYQRFNEMLDRIVTSHLDLQKTRDQLEERVEERTQKLSELNQQNKSLIRAMNQRLEEERKYIARELHDELNSNLIAMRLTTNLIKNLSNGSSEEHAKQLADNADAIMNLIDRTYDSARGIIHRLRPEIIDSLGLIGALQELVNSAQNALPDCHIDLEINGELDNLSDEMNMVLYRILQECLSNIMKHAHATHVHINLTVTCESEESHICLEVSDNGVGFDTISSELGVGILSIRERAASLNGTATLVSSINQGCCVTVHLPV